MNLIKRYVFAVKKRLPLKTREDMANEIESLILDELEDRFGTKENYNDEEITTILKEMGPPYKTVARYREGQSYLVGPDLYEIYRLIIMVATGAVTLGLLISHIIGMFSVENEFATLLKGSLLFFPSLFLALLTMVGAVTMVFYLIQRFVKIPTEKLEKEFEYEWNPKDLPDLPQKTETIKIWEPILGIFFTIVALVILNTLVFANSAGNTLLTTGKFFPVFDIDSLRYYAPLWNISLAGGLALNALLIPIGRRERRINLIEMIINIFDITVMVIMIRGPLLINIEYIRSVYNITASSILDKFLLHADLYIDRFLIVFIALTAIAFTVKMVKVIIASGKE